ncbi:PKD domain-containing protein [Vibrio sp. EJY3]|uniref:PKD domain-containing protein n=1 Tax=Vibrio sp. (strain EJY3) TaxID=1116375 RepID=UPI000243BA44|nr:PKD domain-containing protein [Vibrio sp. EJY3]AEX22115.1 hypothetical protein VEJY3_08135 [Vibrio sp. EJY3]
MKILSKIMLIACTGLMVLGLANNAFASHFRGAHFTWEKVSGNTVTFTINQAWRVNSLSSSSRTIHFGDGTSVNNVGSIVAQPTDLFGSPYEIWKGTVTHTYPGPGPWVVSLESCCRIFEVQNSSSSSFIVRTDVDLTDSQKGSSISSLPPILQMVQGPNVIPLAVADPDSDDITCRMATSSESAIYNIPSVSSGTMTVSNSCVLSWDASTAPDKSKWAVQVIYEEGLKKTAHDFIVEINGNLVANTPPQCSITSGMINNVVAVGTPITIEVTATDADGDNLTVNHLGLPVGATLTPITGTTQSSPMVATFNWTPTSVGLTAVTLQFTDDNNAQCQSSFTIDASNQAPTADAGADDNVNEGIGYKLDGTGSFDPDGSPLSYQWNQIAGPTVSLDDATLAQPSFTAPYVVSNQTVTFELVVFDGALYSSADTVDIVILQHNNEPIADAGDDINIKEGATAELDGTSSYDIDGQAITDYSWIQVGGPSVVLVGHSTANPTFTVPFSVGATLVFQLQVSDGMEYSELSSLPDSHIDGDDLITVTVTENNAPVADAGPDQSKNEGTVVTLNATASYDPDSDGLSYLWEQQSGTPVSLSDSTIAQPTFAAPATTGGEALEFKVTVTDDDSVNPKSSTDTVVINILDVNAPPSCELAVATPSMLWPPNHKMLSVEIAGVTDTDDIHNDITLRITGVTQDEPIEGTGDGDSSPDASIQVGVMTDGALIRTERSGEGDGRVYTINFIADDGFESCTGAVTVGVPHSRKSTPVDSGQVFDSTGN